MYAASDEEREEIATHLWMHPSHQIHDWGQWASAEELESMDEVELHELAHASTAWMGHRVNELEIWPE